MKMNIVPTTEKQEAIRSVVSSAASWPSVSDITAVGSVNVVPTSKAEG